MQINEIIETRVLFNADAADGTTKVPVGDISTGEPTCTRRAAPSNLLLMQIPKRVTRLSSDDPRLTNHVSQLLFLREKPPVPLRLNWDGISILPIML